LSSPCALNDKIYKTLNFCSFDVKSDEYAALNFFIKKHIDGALYELCDFLETLDIHHFPKAKRDQLVKKQIQYWTHLMLHNDFEHLQKESLRIGKAHDRNEISAEIYLMGYNKIISYLQKRIFEEDFKDPSLPKKLLNHISNRILMDISLSLSAYISERERNSLYFYELSKLSSCNQNFKKAIFDILSLTVKRIEMQGICFHGVQSSKFLRPLDTIHIGDDTLCDSALSGARDEIIRDFFLDIKTKKNKCQEFSLLTRNSFSKKCRNLDNFFSKVQTYILLPVKMDGELVAIIELFSFYSTKALHFTIEFTHKSFLV